MGIGLSFVSWWLLPTKVSGQLVADRQMDLALWAVNHGVPAAELAPVAGISAEQAAFVYRDIEAKRRTTRYLHASPRLAVDVAEIAH